jgi:hypothetical protein
MGKYHVDVPDGIPPEITDRDTIARRQAMKALYQEQARELGATS